MTAGTDQSLQRLSALFSDLQPHLLAAEPAERLLSVLTTRGTQAVPGAEHAGVTRGKNGKFETVAATSELPLKVDALQYELGHGPCVDAILENTTFVTGNLAADGRWPDFGSRAAEEFGVTSMLSFRMFLEDDDLIAGLNFYSTKANAFSQRAQSVGLLLSTHGALALSALRRGESAANLTRALASNREIGVAMGVLMAQHKITREQAFDLLRITSQHTQRKLADIAVEVADTGSLELPPL